MMKKLFTLYASPIAVLLLLLMTSCSEDVAMQMVTVEESLPINIESTYPVTANTRATIDNGFVTGDAVGIFVVDYDKDGNSGTLAGNDSRRSNVRFVYDGAKWAASFQLLWTDSHTPADFYGYYPYDQQMESAVNYEFSVSRRQDGDATTTADTGYEISDLLWAKTEKVAPTTETIRLKYKHLMAGITVVLEKGTGFETAEWSNLTKTVQIENTVLGGTVNLTTGATTVSESMNATSIAPLSYNNTWRAVVFPQTVAKGKTVASVTVDGKAYQLKKDVAITYQSGKMHKMTITVDKSEETGQYTFCLTGDDIVAWMDDPDLHEGLVREYVCITVDHPGELSKQIEALGKDYLTIQNLKVTGTINHHDLNFMGQEMKNLYNVNLYNSVIEGDDIEEAGVITGFAEHNVLQHIVFPSKGLWKIGNGAFRCGGLMGSLIIPEGVTEIGDWAFHNGIYGNYNSIGTPQKLTGTLTLPSTLKVIGEGAFGHQGLTGELKFPEGLERIGSNQYGAFGNNYFTGSLHLPSSLKVFSGIPGQFTGDIVVPQGVTRFCTQDDSGWGIGFKTQGSNLVLHDGITELSIVGCGFNGEIIIPKPIKVVGGLAGNNFSRIVLTDHVKILNDGAFADNRKLVRMDFPASIARIPVDCCSECNFLQTITIGKNVDIIDKRAFRNCYNLKSVICENPEPPVIFDNTFEGVPKDNFTIEVPVGSVEKYREAPGWKEFKRISEYSNFVCRPMQANALNTPHTEQLILNADGAWQVERCPDWVTLSKTSGTGKTELTLTFKQMAHGSDNRSDSIIFKMPSENYRTFCVVSQYDYEQEEDSYITLQTHSKGRGIDVVFMGDGYDGEDISNGNYLNLVKQQTEHFFDLEPYKSHRDYFNVYVTFPLSQEKGVNTMNTYVNNRFGTLYGYDGIVCSINQLLTEADEVRNYAVAHSPVTQDNLGRSLIILVPNSDAYSGVTYYEWYGSPISICPPSSRPYPQDTRGVVQHEAGGHGFGYLGDEEIVYNAWAPSNVKGLIDDRHHVGWYANLSTTSGLHCVPWADFVFDTRYSDEVDVFEGGFSYMRGIFRPEQNSCMNYGIPYYNAPSRLSIMRRIFDYAGEGFSMDYFYAHDSKAWGSTSGTRAAGEAFCGSSYAGSNQHRMPSVVGGKKMGNSVRRILNNIKNKNKK